MLEKIETNDAIIYQCTALKSEDPYQLLDVRLVSGKNLLKQRTQAFKWWSLPPAMGGMSRNKIMRSMAKNGLLSGIFTGNIVRSALVNSIIPQEYELHHNHPLALGGNNKKKNYRLIHRKAHTLLHKYVLDPMFKILEAEKIIALHSSEKPIFLKMPLLPTVVTMKEIGMFLTPMEIAAEKDYIAEKDVTTKQIMYEKQLKKPKVVTHHAIGRGQRGWTKQRTGHGR